MDEATRLVSELQGKLAELDNRVWRYQQDMAAEFTKYAEDLLRDVPQDVSDCVSAAIAPKISTYKYFASTPQAAMESQAATGNSDDPKSNGSEELTSAPPALPRSPQHAPPSPSQPSASQPQERGAHARELEFQGLFTPAYLPLLDGSNSKPIPRNNSEDALEHKGKDMEHAGVDASTNTKAFDPPPDFARPPVPRRKNTDEVSFMSDVSDGPRRSALRTSSVSSQTHSPRRVRFNTSNGEVLPSSDPLPHETIAGAESSQSESSDSEEEETFANEEESSPPFKKRVSSTQALRALSRAPLEEDGTQWTTVSAPPDGSASIEGVNTSYNEDSDEEGVTFGHVEQIPIEPVPERTSYIGKSLEQLAEEEEGGLSSDSEGEALTLGSKRRANTASGPISPLPKLTSPKSPTKNLLVLDGLELAGGDVTNQNVTTSPDDDDDDDLPFALDETPSNAFSRPPPSPSPSPPTSPEVEPVAELRSASKLEAEGFYSRSPAQHIPRRARVFNENTSQSLSSYAGHPFNTPIVSTEMHAQAASLGQVRSNYGSLKDRVVGVDKPLGAQSWKGKSMAERLAMEEQLVEEDEVLF